MSKGTNNEGYTNSPLVDYVKISPNRTVNRNHAIDTITIHCVVGQVTVERLGEVFAPASRRASSNYGIGKDGRIGMYCEEKDRSWCSDSKKNDHRAITIEVASDTTHPYAVTDEALNSLVELCTDICKRNNIEKLVWSTNKTDRVKHLNGCNMTVHRDYANKSCPAQYLYDRHGWIADEVNKRLNPTPIPSPTISINQFTPLKGNPTHFTEIVKNIKRALNVDYGLSFNINFGITDILLVNLATVVLSTSVYMPNITYALQQLFVWWGYDLTMDGVYSNKTKSIVLLFQTQVGIPQTGTTTKEFWYKILGK